MSSDEIVPVVQGDGLADPRQRMSELVRRFLAGRKPETTQAYRRDLGLLAEFLCVNSVDEVAWMLFRLPPGEANAKVLAFREMLQVAGMASATVNRRLAAIRSLSKQARMAGIVAWVIEVPDLPTQKFRDTRGPGADSFRKMLAVLEGKTDVTSCRNRAIIRLLYDLGLRRFESVGVLLGHLDLANRRIWILGKGREKREALSLPEPTFVALCDWLRVHPAVRAAQPKQDIAHVPLFVSLDRVTHGHALSKRSVNRIQTELG